MILQNYTSLTEIYKYFDKIVKYCKSLLFYILYSKKHRVSIIDKSVQTSPKNFSHKAIQCNLVLEEIDELIIHNSIEDIEKMETNFNPTQHKWYFFK